MSLRHVTAVAAFGLVAVAAAIGYAWAVGHFRADGSALLQLPLDDEADMAVSAEIVIRDSSRNSRTLISGFRMMSTAPSEIASSA